MRVVGVSRAYRPDAIIDAVVSRAEATAAFREADAIAITAPSEGETRGLINAATLAVMKRSVIIDVNVSRGDIIDEAAWARRELAAPAASAGPASTSRRPSPLRPEQPALEPGQCHRHAACRRRGQRSARAASRHGRR